jgi:hypothetical protein
VSRRGGNDGDAPNAEKSPVLHPSGGRRLGQLLAAFAVIDGAILLICPMIGGDCLYGFFTLIAFPVMLSGPAGMLVPRLALRGRDWRWTAAIWIGGGLLLLAIGAICHVAAVGRLNFHDYGGVLVRHRLLIIELGLAAVSYAGLGVIALVKAPGGAGR